MAEAIVFLAIRRITDHLIHEAVFLHGVRDEVVRLQAELKRMLCFLKDADLKQEQDERVGNWVAEIREVACDAEDVIDTFIIKVACRGGFHRLFKRSAGIFTRGFYLHAVGTNIKSIQTKIADISNSLQTYGIKFAGEGEGTCSSMNEMQRRLRRSYPHAEEDDVICLEGSTVDLMAQLMEEDDRLRIVSIVGMGGLGKTTLAKKAYNHVNVKRHFDCCAWAFISQQYVTRDVLCGILLKLISPSKEEREILEKLKEEELVEKLHGVLKLKRYLVVLDDIWRIESWESIKPAFPNGRKGSKVLFTTRNKEVALYADPRSPPIEPPLLTHEESWELLCMKAFQRKFAGKGECPPEFEELGREMVRKCGGLPLAIVVLGGLLATKKSLIEWEVVERNINAHFNKLQQQPHYGGVYAILALSYHDLPFHLKPCFLYLGHFPEDWEISKKKLIWLWIAEGFVPLPSEAEEEETMEDVADQYLGEMISRCMVQVGRMDHTGRGVKTCRIHDLMRDLCVLKAKEENFLGIIQNQGDTTAGDSSSFLHLTTAKSPRVAIHSIICPRNASERYVPFVQGNPHIRSLLYFVEKDQANMRRRQEIFIYKKFRLLKVLDLECVRITGRSKVPREIGNLIHLRYLGLNCTGSEHLPQSIGNLQSLHTLNIRLSDIKRLPKTVLKLERLRHLLLPSNPGFKCFAIQTLRNLETLKRVKAEILIRNDAVLKLTNLRRLELIFNTSEELEVFMKSPIVRLGRLRTLRMWAPSCTLGFTNLESLSHCRHLSKLRLSGRIPRELHRQHKFGFLPTNISKLEFFLSAYQSDPMAVLEKLPNLRFLNLDSSSFIGSKMVCRVNGFPKLEILKIFGLEELEEWRVEEGAMAGLRSLNIANIPKLRMIPEGLKSITKLRELRVYMMKRQFEKRLQVIDGIEGDDFYKVRHIPSISITNTKEVPSTTIEVAAAL